MHIHLDPVGGIAGDMFIAAVLDAWPEWEADLNVALGQCGLPAGWEPRLSRHRQQAIAGRRFTLASPHEAAYQHAHSSHRHATGHGYHVHGSAHDTHDSSAFREIRTRLAACLVEPAVKTHALGIFTLLAEAEAAVHGVAADDVHFHELADWDSIADIVGAAWLIARIGQASWSVGPLPLGSGTIRTAHGALPVPAPATVRLLAGFEMIDDGISGERVTPTGAAILRYLAPASRTGATGRMLRSGHGLGTRELPDRANLLRLLALETAHEDSLGRDRVAVVSFDIDDQTSEDLALAIDHLRELPDVFNVTVSAVFGKKGRIVQRVQLLCAPASIDEVRSRCFIETSTIGLRWRLEERSVLVRSEVEAASLRVKRVVRPDGRTTAKTDIEEVRAVSSHAERSARRSNAERTVVARSEDA